MFLTPTKFQLCLCMILGSQVTFLSGLNSNISDMQSLLDEFGNAENGTDALDNAFESPADSNGTSQEIVVKKNLYIYPVNAPNLVISQKHEIHAVPGENATNATITQDVHEISLSQVVPLNGTEGDDSDNETSLESEDSNSSVLHNLEIISAYKPGAGLITKEIPLPEEVSKSISLPQNSIADLLSTLNQTAKESEGDESTERPSEMKKREVNPSESKPSELLRSDFSTPLSHETLRMSNENEISAKASDFPAKAELIDDADDMDVAEDIVFRPLFRYRQEARVRPQYSDDSYRRGDRYNYYNNYRYRPRYRNYDYN